MNNQPKFDALEKMTIPMEADQELKVAEKAEELALKMGFGRDPIDEIKLALIEAVINSIEHSKSPDRKVYITFGLNKKPLRMTITISDRGGGFDIESVETPDIKNKIHKKARKRGWGLKLMRSLMDEVLVESSVAGTQITLIKNG